MSWEPLIPVGKAAGAGAMTVTASLRKTVAGQMSITLFLSSALVEVFGSPERVDVAVGREDDAECLRIVESARGGAYMLKPAIRGARRLTVPAVEGVPDMAAAGAPCRILSHGKGEMIVRLPIKTWRDDVASRTKVKVVPVKAAAPSVDVKALPPSGFSRPADMPARLDIVGYLCARGARITRERGQTGMFYLEGALVGLSEVLELANSHRRRAGEPELAAGDVA